MQPKSEVFNQDCLEAMREMPDKAFDLAIVDPPYGIGEDGGKTRRRPSKHIKKNWDSAPPGSDYFNELRRVSVQQIIWGGHYFTESLLPSRCWIVWDKKLYNSDFSDFEMAWASFERGTKIFQYSKNGGDIRLFCNIIHPCQKPVALYKWLLQNYAKPGDTILDTHLGSQSSRIAAYDLGFDFTGYELDADYFKAGCERFERHIKQPQLFAPEQALATQEALFNAA